MKRTPSSSSYTAAGLLAFGLLTASCQSSPEHRKHSGLRVEKMLQGVRLAHQAILEVIDQEAMKE